MIEIVAGELSGVSVAFSEKKKDVYDGRTLTIGMKKERRKRGEVKELFADVAKRLREYEITEASICIGTFLDKFGVSIICEMTEGLLLGAYEQTHYKKEKKGVDACKVAFAELPETLRQEAENYQKETQTVTEAILFAREMVNLPGNKLRPQDFADKICERLAPLAVQTEVFDEQKLREMGMRGLLGIGESSANPPRMLVMRYLPLGAEAPVTALVGKGVTCDTGGYCLKAAGSMLGIKGDMAGGAAVAGAIYALAANHIQTNVIGVIPMCENRISNASLLPGDVITSYDGTSIEVLNTDAEGRIILADAVAYAVEQPQVTAVLDVATLTGAVVNLLGFSIGGVLCDDDALYESFEMGLSVSGERYLRVPFYAEHEKMIESRIADVKNIGESVCGTITAGLFIRKFAHGTPWLHLDIAGTAWVDTPVFAYQSVGATGAAVSSIYQMCCNRGKK